MCQTSYRISQETTAVQHYQEPSEKFCQSSLRPKAHFGKRCHPEKVEEQLAAISSAFNRCDHSTGLVPCVEAEAKEAVGSNETIAVLLTIGQSPANAPPAQGSAANIHQILHQNVGGVLGTTASRLQHGEAGVHEHHQSSTEAKPG